MNCDKKTEKKDLPSDSKKQWSQPTLIPLDVAQTHTPECKPGQGCDGCWCGFAS